MREIVSAIEDGNQRAALALEVSIHHLCNGIGAMLASLGGLDALVFTAGIGENCPAVRKAVATQFRYLGMEVDEEKNAPAA